VVSSVDVRVLGPLEVSAGDDGVELGGPRLRALLALLVAADGRVVGLPALVDALWETGGPPDAGRTARTYVSRLRAALPDGTVETRAPGYALRVGPDAVDARRFERLAAEGRAALRDGRAADAAERLAEGLRLWNGDAYGEFAGTPALAAEGARLERLRLAAVEDRIEAELACGAGAELVGELETLAGRHPGHERLWGQLMTALYRAGRQADALDAFRRARAGMVEAAGVEPSAALTALHGRVLAQDARLLADPAPAAVRPAQLPAAGSAFAGRRAELARLDAALEGPEPTAIWALSGTAGVGKTAMVLHWGHRVAERFPDGQLYVNLHGFDPVRPARDAGEVVRGFLDALGVPGEKVPARPEDRTALFRSLLAGRRMLVVLDNARDAEQVRPLLPGAPGCLTVVTSRDRLTPLVATDGALPLVLPLPSDAEARELLARRLGADRLAAEPAAVDEIIARCARLPLALAVVAGRAATRPDAALGTLAAELGEAAASAGAAGAVAELDAFDAADPATDVRAVLSWSYRALRPESARMFRLLALHPGPDMAPAAAASLAALPVPRARRALAELTTANLLVDHVSGQFCRHDLLTAYAAERVAADETEEDRRAAVRRVLEHYLHTAEAAAEALYAPRAAARAEPPGPQVAVGTFADPDDALAWFRAERGGLLAAVRLAAGTEEADLAEPLAWSCFTFLDRWGHWGDAETVQRHALAATTRLGDRRGQADAHRRLATAYHRLGRHDDAETELRRALDRHVETGDAEGQAHCHDLLSGLRRGQGRPAEALEHSRRALELYRAAGHRAGEGEALNALGWIEIMLCDFRAALVHCGQALVLQREIGDRSGEAGTHDSIGWAHHHLGDHDLALACYRRAIELHRRLGERHQEAEALVHVGRTQRAAGRPAAAREAWRRALALFEELESPDAHDVRAELLELEGLERVGGRAG
jgi:DNA-binding SARP family transcriptional activator/tetratricopeptide (TPR) repeat protein